MVAFIKGSCLLLLGVGVFILMQGLLPLISYKIWEVTQLNQSQPLVAPLAQNIQNGFLPSQILGVSVAEANQNLTSYIPLGTRRTKAAYPTFLVTIPKLKIEKATVTVDSENPDKSLILLPGTALPGERGNMFIAGHSSYEQIFPKGQDYYLSIFKNLTSLKVGDQILVEAQGQMFTYSVESMKVVDPKDTSVINPPDSEGRYITLMTCVPPGTFMKRLIVLGRLQ